DKVRSAIGSSAGTEPNKGLPLLLFELFWRRCECATSISFVRDRGCTALQSSMIVHSQSGPPEMV
ncbi:hypothetical protein, partial [Bradyrhizobium sp. th.b2]|uniref:hypothetical protein n=1 Tax=Bradyrhizobium sp. th-b2 TaxID=172088 RepID=UPI001AEC062B